MATQVVINNLEPEHLGAFHQALRRILSLSLTDYTFAQIVDGLPTRDIYEKDGHYNVQINEHLEPSAEAFEVVGSLKSTFNVDAIQIDSDVAQEYQNTAIGTREFKLRLIEMIAVAFHGIAAQLFETMNSQPYKCPDPAGSIPLYPISPQNEHLLPVPIPTFLYHGHYLHKEQYPRGIADIVGYWAEYQVFGGVVLFDRGESETEFHDVYLDPAGGFRVFKLSETQIEQLVGFTTPEEQHLPCPLPLKAERDTLRIFEHETFGRHMFRNKYERKPPVYTGRTKHPKLRLEDFPEYMDILENMKKDEQKDGRSNG